MKSFLIKTIIIIIPILLIFAYPVYLQKTGAMHGDANIIGGVVFDSHNEHFYTYDPPHERPIKVTEDFSTCTNDSSILIIGDSFTQQGRRSFMEFLQDNMPGWDVYNVQTGSYKDTWYYIHRSLMKSKDTELQFRRMSDFIVYLLEHSPVLPNTIVYESTEIFLVKRIMEMRFHVTDDSLDVFHEGGNVHKVKDFGEYAYKKKFRSNISEELSEDFSVARKWIKKTIGMQKRIHQAEMNIEAFNCEGKEHTLFFGANSFYNYSEDEYTTVIYNLNKLIKMAEDRGVNLIFFAAPDKALTYRKYVNEPMPQLDGKSILDNMAPLNIDPHFQINKRLLISHIDKGEKDIYICSDSHWSYKAAEITAKELAERIRTLNNKNR